MITLRHGTYIVCPNQQVTNPPTECYPYDWLRSVQNDKQEYFYDLDGYVIDFSKRLCTALFLKIEYDFTEPDELTPETLIEAFKAFEITEDTERRINIAKTLEIPLFLAMWPFDYPEKRKEMAAKPVWVFDLNNEEKLILNGSGQDLGAFIFSYRNFSFTNPKGLNAAKTYMECALSRTTNPFPGDLDCVVWNKESAKTVGLIEFKTHNLATPISDETKNKYADQDARRFRVLSYLQSNIAAKQGHVPTLLFVVWGPRHDEIKVQIIENNAVKEQHIIASPQKSNDFETFYKELMQFI